MRTNSKQPRKQRSYEYNISKHEAHKLMSVSLSKKLRQEKGFRNLPVREGDTVLIVRGDYKGKSGKVNRTEPQNQAVFVDGIVNKKTDASEIGVPIHPSNLVITNYEHRATKRDARRLSLINRKIADDDAKIDIESVLAEAEAEEEEAIEFDDDEFEDDDDLLLDEDLDEDLEEEEVDENFDLVEDDEDEEEEADA